MGSQTDAKTYSVERPAALVLVTAATAEPVSLVLMKEYLRFTESSQDDTINACISAARIEAEQKMGGRAILSQTFDLILDEFPDYCQRTPDAEIVLPRFAVSSVTHLKYYDDDGVLQTWDASNYRVDTSSEPGRITPAFGVSWPSARTMIGAIQVRFVAATWASAALTPEPIKLWIRAKAAHLFTLRGMAVSGTIIANYADSIDSLLAPYTVRRFV